jgi:hypothetical protein
VAHDFGVASDIRDDLTSSDQFRGTKCPRTRRVIAVTYHGGMCHDLTVMA